MNTNTNLCLLHFHAKLTNTSRAYFSLRQDNSHALFEAAFKGQEACVRALIAANADLMMVNKLGWTALHAAGYNGYASICRILVDEGASLTIVNSAGKTPLEMARAKGNVECEAIIEAPEESAIKVITGTAPRGFRFAVTKAAGEQAPLGLDRQIYDAANKGKHDELLDLCQEWAGHAVIDTFESRVSLKHDRECICFLTYSQTFKLIYANARARLYIASSLVGMP